MGQKNLKEERIGTIRVNKYGSTMKVVEYINKKDIWVQFEQGSPVHTNWKAFIQGKVRCKYDKSVFGVGYFGEGVYESCIKGKMNPQYLSWQSMLQRCYDQKFQERNPTYKGITVCEEWLNYQNFAEWYDNNYYEIEGEVVCLDKDILIKGTKEYSPSTSCFTPKSINSLFTKANSKRGEFPIGVYLDKSMNKYVAHVNKGTKQIHLNRYNTPEEAFDGYKIAKEKYIKQIADQYKEKIPEKLYNALITYQVDIDD